MIGECTPDAWVDRDGSVYGEAQGAALLDEARRLLTTYVALPNGEAADGVVLWAAATHALPALPFAPRLSVRSATKRSGKSRVLDVVAPMTHNPLKTVNATVAAIFRSLGGDHPPTLIFDEADSIFGSKKVAEQNEDLRGLLNAGFERGNPSIRCVGPMQIPTEFPSFAMAALAGIGSLPDTIEDRSLVIHMKRRKATETVKPFRLRRDRPALERLGERLAEWLTAPGVVATLENSNPASDLEDRAADVWEALLMVADLAGGHWPERARTAAKVLIEASARDEGTVTLGVQLLHDLAEVFKVVKSAYAPTKVLLHHLYQIEGAPWADMELTAHRVGRLLNDFEVFSKHAPDKSSRGYYRSHFADSWERYPPPGGVPEQHAEQHQRPHGQERAGQPSEASATVQTPPDQARRWDASGDASDGTTKASGKASRDPRRSDVVRTLPDASDGTPAENKPCDRCSAKPSRMDRHGNRLCQQHGPRLFQEAS